MLDYLEQNKDITNFSGYKTKAVAKYFFELKEKDDLEKLWEIVDFANKNDLKIIFLWWGTNILFAFDVFEGVIIKNNLKWFEVKNWILEVNSGESVVYLASKLEKDYGNLSLKPWSSLPGTVGWAVAWNAGCFWLEVKDIFIEACLYSFDENMIFNVDSGFMQFWYRTSFLKNNREYFLVSVKFDISKNVDHFFTEDFRLKNQPKWFSCGSVFGNPPWDFAGRILDKECHLNWTKRWWAKISDLHSNIITTDGTATHQDVLYLINLAKKMTFEKIWVELKQEINIIEN
ncbi:MAG: UDP-N-acetylmuramate dehydrogenase [uncultured bacterium (gcode 4)]|uniref:UDP-N-acetylenolpyruvoylglucosamine reductase n=1 Tax=uncultured bacterium (gcode 4) TaxID=1234023 RepID=K2BD65_9BACT|nr:MAG: UDP-N-acetylmuramate dehydrogenase [uncultured bacterium (gcode 4)]